LFQISLKISNFPHKFLHIFFTFIIKFLYVSVNEGGLSYPYDSKNSSEALFSGSLRNYHKIPSYGSMQDFFQVAQRCKTTKEIIQDKILRNSQKDLIFRLTNSRNREKCKSYRTVFQKTVV